MATRTKILVVDSDLDILSRIYLALVHRNYKAEASDNAEEITERIKRLKPALLILGNKELMSFKGKLKIPCIVLMDKEDFGTAPVDDYTPVLKHPLQLDALIKKIEELVF